MPDLFSQNINIENYLDHREVIEETAAQLIKDFSEFSFEITFTGKGKTPYDELFSQAEPVIALLLEKNTSLLHSILYRIDVAEKEIKLHSQKFPQLSLSHIITDLILRREMKKVLTRRYFKGK